MEQTVTKGKIVHDIEDRAEYKKTYPNLTGKDHEALHEIHIFLLPLNPEKEVLAKCIKDTERYNAEKIGDLQDYSMKMCYLTLVFRNLGPVKVMQSSRYYRSNDLDKVIEQAYIDADFYASTGLDVIRIKIEANAICNDGIPLTDEDVAAYSTKYFEHHIKLSHKNAVSAEEITEEESNSLIDLSKKYTVQFKTPLPISWNNVSNTNNPDNPGHQRFINVRFRNMGYNTIKEKLKEIKDEINNNTNFKVAKSIDEYVWYDTFTKLDHGWIDFTPEELVEVIN